MVIGISSVAACALTIQHMGRLCVLSAWFPLLQCFHVIQSIAYSQYVTATRHMVLHADRVALDYDARMLQIFANQLVTCKVLQLLTHGCTYMYMAGLFTL